MASLLTAALVVLLIALAAFWLAYCSQRNFLFAWRFIPAVRERLGKFVDTPFGRAHYHHAGQGKSGHLIVMLAGVGHDGSYWPEILEHVGRHSEIIAVDLFGRGGTDAAASPYSPDKYAQLVREVLEKLSLDKRPIVACGISFGGAIAAHLAATTSSVVGAYLIVPAGIAVTDGYGACIDLSCRIPRGIIDVVGVAASIGTLFARAPSAPENTEPGFETRARRVWLYSFQDYVFNPSFFRAYMLTMRTVPLGTKTANLHDSYRRLKRLGSKLHFVLAHEDNVVSAAGVEAFVGEELPEAVVTKVKGGHEVQWERPLETSEMLCRFVGSLKA